MKNGQVKKRKSFFLFKIFLIIALIFSISSLEVSFRHGEPAFISYFYIPLILFKVATLLFLFNAKEELAKKISVIFLVFCIVVGGISIFIKQPAPCVDYFDANKCKLSISYEEKCFYYENELICQDIPDTSWERINEKPKSFSGDFGRSLTLSFVFLNPIRDSYTLGNSLGLFIGFSLWIFILSKKTQKNKN